MGFAGSSSVALMVKETLSEIVRNLQGVPGYMDTGMDGVSDVVFRTFKVIAGNIGQAIFQASATEIIFAGYCTTNHRLRAFRMEANQQNVATLSEVLTQTGDIEFLGSGARSARTQLGTLRTQRDILQTLKNVIDDPSIADVGGNLQFGEFKEKNFQPFGMGLQSQSPSGISYFRGSVDYHGPDFDHTNGLLPRFPLLDLITNPLK
ncbi:hypothetical protein [Fulvimarina sp. MAC3]|uniref:hypothetical protein n=1 Tax=Fulvimarina sp. MAC3 TaxID=3148887 RepID=UPI0031FCFE27